MTTAWVKRPYTTVGQDHLAARAVSERIYATLLPGITNVTDRARYYSFYPWLAWAMDQQGRSLAKADVIDTLRRAECLVTLVAAVHARDSAGDSGVAHDEGLVGRTALTKALPALFGGGAVRLSDYAHQDPTKAETRYFKNPKGGLGQYYLGPLSDLGVLAATDDRGRVFGYTLAGKEVAKAFDLGVDRHRFFEVLDGDEVTLVLLRSLASFCACRCRADDVENRATIATLLTPTSGDRRIAALRRRATLLTVLDLAETRAQAGQSLTVDVFRAALYSGAARSGAAWQQPPVAQLVAPHWRTYQRGEMLSVAVQSLLWLVCTTLAEEGEGVARTGDALIQLAMDVIEPVLEELPPTYRGFLASREQAQPALMDWESPHHELQLTRRVLASSRGKTPDQAQRAQVAREVLELLMALSARTNTTRGYGELQFGRAYLSTYRINLVELDRLSEQTWIDLSMVDWVRWLLRHWVVERHLAVALRKLRSQGNDTFRFRPHDQGLTYVGWTDTLQPTYSSPRLRQAFAILRDLGLLSASDGGWVPTARGRALLAAADA